jgi:NAD(P)-dependent dehydrogenase (short-subunit alcohol dehydrogenase family)
VEFKGKKALVTGATRGIGRATARILAQGGADVCVNYFRSRKNADETVEELKSLGTDAFSVRYIPGYAAIGVSKAAIETLTKYLAYEFAQRKINVNTVSGGFIDTDALKGFDSFDRMLSEVVRRTPYGRACCKTPIIGTM